MTTAANPISLPITTVQHDFETVLTDVREGTVTSEDFWISCYHKNEPSVHGKVRAELDEKDRQLVSLKGRDGVQIERGDQVRTGPYFLPATQILKGFLLRSTPISFLVLSWASRKRE